MRHRHSLHHQHHHRVAAQRILLLQEDGINPCLFVFALQIESAVSFAHIECVGSVGRRTKHHRQVQGIGRVAAMDGAVLCHQRGVTHRQQAQVNALPFFNGTHIDGTRLFRREQRMNGEREADDGIAAIDIGNGVIIESAFRQAVEMLVRIDIPFADLRCIVIACLSRMDGNLLGHRLCSVIDAVTRLRRRDRHHSFTQDGERAVRIGDDTCRLHRIGDGQRGRSLRRSNDTGGENRAFRFPYDGLVNLDTRSGDGDSSRGGAIGDSNHRHIIFGFLRREIYRNGVVRYIAEHTRRSLCRLAVRRSACIGSYREDLPLCVIR